jgi:hypothetical protein
MWDSHFNHLLPEGSNPQIAASKHNSLFPLYRLYTTVQCTVRYCCLIYPLFLLDGRFSSIEVVVESEGSVEGFKQGSSALFLKGQCRQTFPRCIFINLVPCFKGTVSPDFCKMYFHKSTVEPCFLGDSVTRLFQEVFS